MTTFEAVDSYEDMVQAADWLPYANKTGRIELGIWLESAERVHARGATNIGVRFKSSRVIAEGGSSISKLLPRYDHDDATPKHGYLPETRQLYTLSKTDRRHDLRGSLFDTFSALGFCIAFVERDRGTMCGESRLLDGAISLRLGGKKHHAFRFCAQRLPIVIFTITSR